MSESSDERLKFIDSMRQQIKLLSSTIPAPLPLPESLIIAHRVVNRLIFYYLVHIALENTDSLDEKLAECIRKEERFYEGVIKPILTTKTHPLHAIGLFQSNENSYETNLVVENKFTKVIFDILHRNSWSFEDAAPPNVITPQVLSLISLSSADQKKHGIYYTPQELVRKISGSALNAFLNSKDSSTICLSEITILDPSAGSGEFLIAAANLLANSIAQTTDSMDLELLTKIYEDNIFGIELDRIITENCKLRIWISLLSHINAIEDIRSFPSLTNIKTGNALLGFGFHSTSNDFASHLQSRVKEDLTEFLTKNTPFHWQKAFPKISGFDIIIGNPPWGSHFTDIEKTVYRELLFKETRMDLFFLFLIRCTNLLAPDGVLSFVIPDILLHKNYPNTRLFLLDHYKILSLEHVGLSFEQVIMYAVVFLGQKEISEEERKTNVMSLIRQRPNSTDSSTIPQTLFHEMPDYKFNLDLTPERWATLNQIRAKGILLKDILSCHEGIHSGNVRGKIFSQNTCSPYAKPLIFGRGEVQRYQIKWKGWQVIYDPQIIDKSKGEYAGFGKPEYFEVPKLLVTRTGYHLKVAFDSNSFYASNNLFTCFLRDQSWSLEYILALLNSKLMTFYFHLIHPRGKQVYSEVKITHLNQFPLKRPTKLEEECILILVRCLHYLKQHDNELFSYYDEEVLDPLIFEMYFIEKKQAYMTRLMEIFEKSELASQTIEASSLARTKMEIENDSKTQKTKKAISSLQEVQVVDEFLSSTFHNS